MAKRGWRAGEFSNCPAAGERSAGASSQTFLHTPATSAMPAGAPYPPGVPHLEVPPPGGCARWTKSPLVRLWEAPSLGRIQLTPGWALPVPHFPQHLAPRLLHYIPAPGFWGRPIQSPRHLNSCARNPKCPASMCLSFHPHNRGRLSLPLPFSLWSCVHMSNKGARPGKRHPPRHQRRP